MLRLGTIRFFRLEGSRERAARGFAVGLTCNFFPTFGLGAFLSGFLARLVGGNMAAGFLGGTVLAIFWPLLFLANMRVGSWFVTPVIIVDELNEVTVKSVSTLVLGQTFAIGALINSVAAAVLAYFGFLFLYGRLQPHAQRWLRRRARLKWAGGSGRRSRRASAPRSASAPTRKAGRR